MTASHDTRRYRAYGRYLRERFGLRVARISIDAGFTCPNVDGTVTTGGCVFCDNQSFTPGRRHRLKQNPAAAQIRDLTHVDQVRVVCERQHRECHGRDRSVRRSLRWACSSCSSSFRSI